MLVPWLANGGIYVIEDVFRENVETLRRKLPLLAHVIDFEYSTLQAGADMDRLVVMYEEEMDEHKRGKDPMYHRAWGSGDFEGG